MKKSTYLSFAFLIWISTCLSNALAADFYLIDSDRDVYHVGQYLGKMAHHESYHIQYYPSESPFTARGEGFLYYDSFQQSLKLLIFENNEYFGFTQEGHWSGDGSTTTYVNSQGETGQLGLFFGNSFPRSRSKEEVRIKNNKK